MHKHDRYLPWLWEATSGRANVVMARSRHDCPQTQEALPSGQMSGWRFMSNRLLIVLRRAHFVASAVERVEFELNDGIAEGILLHRSR